MSESVDRLQQFLLKNYIQNKRMGSPDMETAIRDVLVDIMHLSDIYTVSTKTKFAVAREVYEQEISLEVQHKTGVQD